MTNNEIRDSIDLIWESCTADFATANPGRLGQLASALATAEMAVDALYTEVPYRLL